MAANVGSLLPFLKWAGGKRWFIDRFHDLIPKHFDRYIEPFLGSGAVFFFLKPRIAYLADLNEDLIKTYKAIRNQPYKVSALLLNHQNNHTKEYYYKMRANKPTCYVDLAAWLIYLNRTCWNGLYRVNRLNEFNVPIGAKNSVVLKTDNFTEISKILRRSSIFAQDFSQTIELAEKGDFVFVDPPYTVRHNSNGFVKYNDSIFTWEDQVRLRDCIHIASKRGARFLITNANHESIRKLYSGLGKQVVLTRPSVLAAESKYRSHVEELAILT